MRMTRTSSEREKSSFLKFSAWMENDWFWLNISSILVSPSTMRATTGPKPFSMSVSVYSVSSTTSCNKAQTTAVGPSPISSTTIWATSSGW